MKYFSCKRGGFENISKSEKCVWGGDGGEGVGWRGVLKIVYTFKYKNNDTLAF